MPSLKKTIILCVLVFAVGSLLHGSLLTSRAWAEVIFSEDFEGSPPHPLQDSFSVSEVIATAVWSNVPPTGWSIDNSQMSSGGVPEFTGWVFLDKAWWDTTAGGQGRSNFTSGSGTVAVADGDEWHDLAFGGDMHTWISTPSINTAGYINLELAFDSSWQMEVTQEASLEVSYDGGPKQLLFHWDCEPSSPDYHDTNFNEHITIPLNDTDSVVITFGYYNADNDWWWAFDNVQITGTPIKEGLIGYWPYEGNTDDASGLGNDGIAVNSPSYVTGKFGSALDFNGSNQYVTMDAVADDFSDNDVTMSGWLKTTETGEADWYSNNSTNGQFLLCNDEGEPIMWEDPSWRIYAGVTINDDAWHHIVITREDMVVKLYVDGVQRGGTYTSTISFTASDRWSIAQEWDGASASDFYEGIVDDVALWDRALSAYEISWLWNNGDGNPILGNGNADIVESGEDTVVTEGGATDDYTIKLDSIPTDPVMITATPSDAQIDLGSGAGIAVTLTFTSSTWNTPQTVTVTAYDDDVYEGKAAHITDITHSAASDDSNYD
ncbi:MAG: hypothetical protein JXD22_09315, partial [Sedimentisphaerales bacterium]|nr:hypothetical protein [Sedimentisphaerales bacterium]